MKQIGQTKKQKISAFIITALLVLAVVLCIYVVAQVLSCGYVKIGPYSLFRVVTGSMEPAMPVGTLLVSKAVDMDQVQLRDIVCFRATVLGQAGEVVTHRVVGISQMVNGGILLETKGDANVIADIEYVTQNNFVGLVTWYSKSGNPLPDIMSFLTSRGGFLLCIIVPCLFIVGMILKSCVGGIREELKAIMDELIGEEDVPEAAPPCEVGAEQTCDQEEYERMAQRIRQELMEEMGLSAPLQGQGEQAEDGASAEELRQSAEE